MATLLSKTKQILPAFLLAALVLSVSACSQKIAAASQPAVTQPAASQPAVTQPVDVQRAVQATLQPCTGQICAGLIVTRDGQPARLEVSDQGVQSAAPLAQPKQPPQDDPYVIDTGAPSPNGQWVAYTSLAAETGGPVFLNNTQTGEWINLIQSVNARLTESQPPLQEESWWDVIGWFPDSTRLLVGPSDLSMVAVVDIVTYSSRIIPYPGGGKGGRLFVDLAPDGSRFLFIGEDQAGSQVVSAYDLTSNQVTELQKLPYDQGVLYNPRFSPDQEKIAYLVQKGRPDTGLTYSIDLFAPQSSQASTLVEGNLGMTVIAWSPDGSQIAFTRKEADIPHQLVPETAPPAEDENVWVVSVDDGTQTQVTFLQGQVRAPAWASDSKTLAFVTHDGQVGVTNLEKPGEFWQAAGPSGIPSLTSAFFLP
jgi:hypothetical protein